MATLISAGTTTGTGIAITPDTTGQLAFQTNGSTTALTIDTSQNSTFVGNATAKAVIPTGATVPTNGMYLADTNTVAFASNSTEAARINSSGNLLIGSTTSGGTLTVKTSSTGYLCQLFSNLNQADYMQFRNDGSIAGSITRSGGSNVNYNTSSDYRLKENVVPMVGALDKVALLKPCTYTWKIDGSTGQGFIAHELQSVIPDAVHGEKDAVDTDGNINPQGIDQSRIVATLTAAVQELHEIVKTQAEQISALQTKVGA